MKKIHIQISISDVGAFTSGIDLSQRFDIAPVDFDQVIEIQRAFYDLANRLADRFKPTIEQSEAAAKEELARRWRGMY